MTDGYDENYIGEIALKKELITGEQLDECEKLREQSSPKKSLARVLFEKGYLTDEQLGELLAEYKLTVGELMPEESDPGSIGFGEAVVKEGLAKNVDIWDAVEERAGRKIEGTSDKLGQILVERGTLAVTEAQKILESQGKRILKCVDCGHQYDVKEFNPNKEYTCLNCGGPLSAPEAVSSLNVQGTAVDSQTVKQSMDDRFVGTEIGGCEILEKLGEGGMGAVYRARHITLNKVVAVKVMSSALMGEIHRKRFLREARAAAQLEHLNIVQVHDTGVAEGYNYIVMQFIDGESIQRRINRQGKFEQKESLKVIRAAADALGFAHKRHMIHRDIKPDNIMVTSDGIVKVADFGLVKSTEIEKDLTGMSQSMLMGTPHYMSPEQFEGKIIDHRTDIYSLGVTLYYMLTGQKPYEGTTPYQIMQGHLQQEFVDPSNLSEDIYPAVSQFVRKMMAREREHRYQTCEDVISDIDRVLGGFEDGTIETEDFIIVEDDLGPTMHAEIPGTPAKAPPTKAPSKKKSALIIIVPAAILIIGVVAVLALLLLSGPKEKENGEKPAVVEPPPETGEIDPKAQAAFDLTKQEADDLAGQNLFFDAWSKWDGFVPKWGDDPWKPKVEYEREVLIEKALARISQLLASGELTKDQLQTIRDQVNKLNDASQSEELAAIAERVGKMLEGMEASEETVARLLKEFEDADLKGRQFINEGKLADARKVYDPKYTSSEISQIRSRAEQRIGEIDRLLETRDKLWADYRKAQGEADALLARNRYGEAKAKYLPFTEQDIIAGIRDEATAKLAEIDQMSMDREQQQFETVMSQAQEKFDMGAYAQARELIVPYLRHTDESFKKQAQELDSKIDAYEDFQAQMTKVDQLRNRQEYAQALQIARRFAESANTDFAKTGKQKVRQIRKERYLDKQLVFVDGGNIPIGSDDLHDRNPARSVDIKPFYLDRTEVTNAQYEEFVRATGRQAPLHWSNSRPPEGRADHPVAWVTCRDAIEYCKWRSQQEDATYRLPTESEWEYAASYDPETSKKSVYPWGDEFDKSHANLSGGNTQSVGSKEQDKSPLGVYDLAGNVAEWTSSDDGKSYVVRGGSMDDEGDPQTARVSFRHQTDPNTKGAGIGFRCVREE